MSDTPTTNMNLVLPTDHGDSDVWGPILATAFGLIDQHDHTTGKGVKIPSAALNINGDVSWSSHAITSALALGLASTTPTSVASYVSTIFVNASDSNNLYFRNASGVNVKITDGSTINVSVTGGIGGDYAAVGALVDFDDASDTYRFRQQTGSGVRQFAYGSFASINLFEFKAVGSSPVPPNRVRLSSPASLAASYELSFPAAVPGSTSFVACDTSGALSFSNAIASMLTTTVVKETSGRTQIVHAASAQPVSGYGGAYSTSNTWSSGSGSGTLIYPLPISYRTGITVRVDAWTIFFQKTSNSPTTITAGLYYFDQAGTVTQVGSSSTNSASNPGWVSLGATLVAHNTAAYRQYYVQVSTNGGTGDNFAGVAFATSDT